VENIKVESEANNAALSKVGIWLKIGAKVDQSSCAKVRGLQTTSQLMFRMLMNCIFFTTRGLLVEIIVVLRAAASIDGI